MAGATRATSAHQCVFTFQKSGIWKITLHFKQKTIREIRRRTSLSKNARVLKVTAMCYSTQSIKKFKFVLPLPSDNRSIKKEAFNRGKWGAGYVKHPQTVDIIKSETGWNLQDYSYKPDSKPKLHLYLPVHWRSKYRHGAGKSKSSAVPNGRG